MKLFKILSLLLLCFSIHSACSKAKFGGAKKNPGSGAPIPQTCEATKTCPPPVVTPPGGPTPIDPLTCKQEWLKCTDDSCRSKYQECGVTRPGQNYPGQNDPNQNGNYPGQRF